MSLGKLTSYFLECHTCPSSSDLTLMNDTPKKAHKEAKVEGWGIAYRMVREGRRLVKRRVDLCPDCLEEKRCGML